MAAEVKPSRVTSWDVKSASSPWRDRAPMWAGPGPGRRSRPPSVHLASSHSSCSQSPGSPRSLVQLSRTCICCLRRFWLDNATSAPAFVPSVHTVSPSLGGHWQVLWGGHTGLGLSNLVTSCPRGAACTGSGRGGPGLSRTLAQVLGLWQPSGSQVPGGQGAPWQPNRGCVSEGPEFPVGCARRIPDPGAMHT